MPYPALPALAGDCFAAAAAPRLHTDAGFALALLVAPAAGMRAFEMPPRGLLRNWLLLTTASRVGGRDLCGAAAGGGGGAGARGGAGIRRPSARFMLNFLALLLMGLQARVILTQLHGEPLRLVLAFSRVVLGVVIGVRFVWV